jgi:RNA polymerase sigma-70 factor (ECF subfamily)
LSALWAVSPLRITKIVMPDLSSAAAGQFPTTHWSRVAQAGDLASPDARAALAELCSAYWYPIYVLIRRRGHDADAALDLTQDYFARLLAKGTIAAADHRKGRFRAFLRTDCGFFLAHEHERGQALKRGGGRAPLSIDARDAEGCYLREPADDTTPERLFDRTWALNLLGTVLDRLAREYADMGRAAQFEALQGGLGGTANVIPYAELATRLGTTEAAVQQAVRRLRLRYRVLLREAIAATLNAPDEAAIDDEIHGLFAALAR